MRTSFCTRVLMLLVALVASGCGSPARPRESTAETTVTVPSAQAVAASEPAAPPSAPPPPSASPVATSAPASAASGLRASTGGHPATREDCDELFAKSAEIELRGHNITDPKTIAERTAAARATPKGSEFTAQCMGKRITRQALECVRKATTAEQVDDCL